MLFFLNKIRKSLIIKAKNLLDLISKFKNDIKIKKILTCLCLFFKGVVFKDGEEVKR